MSVRVTYPSHGSHTHTHTHTHTGKEVELTDGQMMLMESVLWRDVIHKIVEAKNKSHLMFYMKAWFTTVVWELTETST